MVNNDGVNDIVRRADGCYLVEIGRRAVYGLKVGVVLFLDADGVHIACLGSVAQYQEEDVLRLGIADGQLEAGHDAVLAVQHQGVCYYGPLGDDPDGVRVEGVRGAVGFLQRVVGGHLVVDGTVYARTGSHGCYCQDDYNYFPHLMFSSI